MLINHAIYFGRMRSFTLSAEGYLKFGTGSCTVGDQVNAYASAKMSGGEAPAGVVNGKFLFKKHADGTFDKTKVVCIYCSDELSFHRSTTSLKYHLKAKHVFETATSKSATNTLTTSRGARQTTLGECARGNLVNKSTTDKLSNAFAKWIATACRPINIIEDQGLQNIMHIATGDPSYKLPSRGTITTRINELYSTNKTTKSQLLADAKFISLTGDHWTSVSNHNYLGVTAHWIDDKWEILSFALGVLKTEERHFAEACAGQFLQVAKDWNITEKISTLGTDSAPNMVAAARSLPFQHLPCVAHAIQRVIAVAFRDCGFDVPLAKCRKLVGHFKHSPANALELKAQQVAHGLKEETLVQDVPTRWNSTLAMIKRIQHNKEPLRATLAEQRHNLALLTPAEYDKLEKLEALLEPCSYISELLGGEKYVSCSIVLPALCHLLRTMEVSDVDPAYILRFKVAFTKDLIKRKENLNLAWLKVATALDPRFKDLRCLPRAERGEVWQTLSGMLRGGAHEPQGPMDETEQEPPPKKMSLLLIGSESESEDEGLSTDNSLERYKAEPSVSIDTCPLKWWSAHSGTYSELTHIARKYLAAPASTVPCERLFSLAGHIVQKKRSALSAENVNKLVCLSNWLKEE